MLQIRYTKACWTFGTVLAFLLVIVPAVCLLYERPYNEFYAVNMRQRDKCLATVQSSMCSNPAERMRVEGYNYCEAAELWLQMSVRKRTFYDVLESQNILCMNGQCLFRDTNVSSVVWLLLTNLPTIYVVLSLLSCVGLFTTQMRYTPHQLPQYCVVSEQQQKKME